MRWTARLSTLLVLTLLTSACRVHIVGDSTAGFVQLGAANRGYTITGSPIAGCGFTVVNGNRLNPDTGGNYPVCVTDWNGSAPDAGDDIVIAFVSLHDAKCSTVDGCLPIDATAYGNVHADLLALGYPVVWVETPVIGGPIQQSRLAALNAAVSAELGCTLVDSSVREAETWDGIHYTQKGADVVGYRLAVIAENPTPC